MQFPLYPYQQEGFSRFMERGNLLLAFDTGLGKTATAIALAEELLALREVGRVLLVVPANLKLQWARSIAKFTNLPTTELVVKGESIVVPDPGWCVIVDGTPVQRERQYRQARSALVDYVIVGYEQVVSDFRRIKQLGCEFVVIDEASAIKTPGTKRTGAVKRHLKAPYRLALTATPIENRPEEVYSIMQWVDADVLGRHDLFDRTYIKRNPWGKVESYMHLDVLHDRLSVAMVRKTRLDPEVAPYMPEVDHEVWRVAMDDETRSAYLTMAADLLAAYEDVGDTGGSFDVNTHYGMGVREDRRGDKSALGRLMSVHGVMEMLLAHPQLVHESGTNYLTTDNRGSKYAAEVMAEAVRRLPHTEPKLDFLIRSCDEILTSDPSAKILTFSWFKGMLPLMSRRLADLGYGTTIYSGDMSTREKEASVQRFKTSPDVRVFLSSHAGAYGTDLPEANWLINYDIPWGSGKATQINGRHVRASSEFKLVHVRDIVMAGTVEERKLGTKNFKGGVAGNVIDGKGGTGSVKSEVESLHAHAKELVDTA
jgi:SNF2 family DNA or RNA helicase